MSTPLGNSSYREIRSSRSYSESPVTGPGQTEQEIIAEHSSMGWVQEEGSPTELVFSNRLGDGRKWTRHYDRASGTYVAQRLHEAMDLKTFPDWPPVHFGD
jgi:hypothetical protein